MLAISCTLGFLSIAVSYQNKIFKRDTVVNTSHTENFLPLLSEIMSEIHITIDDIKYILYNQGPGSFTALRVGLAFASGLSYNKKKLIGISEFFIAAHHIKNNGYSDKYSAISLREKPIFAVVNMENMGYLIEPTKEISEISKALTEYNLSLIRDVHVESPAAVMLYLYKSGCQTGTELIY